MKNFSLSGLLAPVFTPFDSSGNLNLKVIGQYADYLISKGMKGVFISGTTGEGLLMSVEERKKLLEAWMPFQSDLKILAHIATTNYIESSSLAKHAENVGADAISCMGPCYLPPKGVKELVDFNRIVASAAPQTPFYYYHLPPISGVNVKMNEFLKVAGPKIPNLVGIKYTSMDIMDMQECVLLDDRKYNILHGHDGIFLSGLSAGVAGGIGTSYNLIPEIFHKIILAFDKGDMETARKLQMSVIQYLKVMHKYENSLVSTKAMLNLLGLKLRPCRLPVKQLTPNEINNLEKDLRSLEFFSAKEIC